MKQKLLIALLTAAAVTGLLAGNVAADATTDGTWGTGGWDVPKQRTAWNPDGVWMEGEYYTVDLSTQPEGTVNYAGNSDGWVQDFSMGMSWDEDYLYTFIMFEGGYCYTDTIWDGCCIQFGGTDVGNTGFDRLEYGITFNTNDDCNRTALWGDYLNSGYADGTDTDDFRVFIRDGMVVYEMRTPFSAFSLTSIEENAQVGVCYVIANGNDDRLSHTQIGYGITGDYGKVAERFCPITLTAAPEAETWENNGYNVHFHNIGGNWFDMFDVNEFTDADLNLMTFFQEDGILYENREALDSRYGYSFVGFRPILMNGTRPWDLLYRLDDELTLNTVLFTDSKGNEIRLKDYCFKETRVDGVTFNGFLLTAVYEPKQYTIKFLDEDDSLLAEETVWFGDHIIDYFPEIPTKDGPVFDHWVSDDGFKWYYGYYETGYPLDEDLVTEYFEPNDNTFTLRAVYKSDDTVLYSGTVGDNIPWQITADGTLTVGRVGDAVDGEGSYSIPDWENPFTYDMSVENWLDDAIARGEVNPWIKHQSLIKALVIGDDIDYIGNYSFQSLYLIEDDVIIPNSVKAIGEGAFQYNNFASITIGEGVESLAAYSFNSSWKLTSIHIPASVCYIDAEAFKWCEQVEAFTVDENNQWHTAVDGVLFTKDMETLIRYPWAKTDTDYTVPNGVTELQATCFEASGNLTEITLPESLEVIGWWALSNLNVTELVIPANVNSVQDSAFRNCYDLTDIYFQGNKPADWQGDLFTLHNDEGEYDYFNENIRIHYKAAAGNWGDIVGEYGDYMVIDGGYRVEFRDDDGETSVIDEQLLDIGNTITVPAAWEKDYGAFAHWFAWERDYITTANDTTIPLTQELLDEAGYDTNWDDINDTIVFEAQYDLYGDAPEFRAEGWIDTNEDGTNDIHWFVEWNRNLTVESTDDNKVSIPDYYNGERAPWHDYASYIRSVNIWNNIDRIGSYAFADLFVLDGVDIPGDVKSIGMCAFYNCTRLGWINIHDGVEAIDHDAFCGVDMYNSIWIPASVTDINDDAFASFRTNYFDVDGNNPNYWSDEQGILYKHNGDGTSTLLAYSKNDGRQAVVIPAGVTVIHEYAFEDAEDVRTVQLPETLTTIEDYAFRNANLRMVHIPATVTSIGEEAFRYNWGLEGAYFYGNVPTMGNDVFTNTSGDFRIYHLNGKSGFDSLGYNTNTFSATDDYASGVIDYDWNNEHIHLEWNITKDGWLNVEGEGSIPDHEHPWYEYLAYVRKVDIDDRITYIGDSAFCELTHVDTINLPKNVTHIGDGAFNAVGSSGNNIGVWILPGQLTTICKYAFGNLGITKVTIPASLEEIESGWAFFDNPITTYAVENGSTNFGVDNYGALYELDASGNKVALVAYPRDAAYTSYTVPDGVKELYGASIRNACNLTEVNLPDTLEVIGNEAMAHYYNDLYTLTIPASVNTIYSNAFRWGNKTSITFLGDKPEFINDGEGEGNQFWDNREDFTIYYYEDANGWDTYDAMPTYMLQAGEEPFVARGDFWDGWDIHWTLDKNGVLNITGSGEIPGNWGGYSWREYMDQVKEIVIEDGITRIGDWMFWDCNNVTKLTLPNSLESIGNNAFFCNPDEGDGKLGELVLPEGLKRLEYRTFYNCGLTKVTIPSTMQEFDAASFEKNPIEAYVVAEGNPEFATDENGVLFQLWYDEDEDGKRIDGTDSLGALAAYPAGSSMTSYTVPDTVGDIWSWAFSHANNLTKLNLNHAWGYSDHSIYCCDNLTSLVLPENIDWMNPEAIYGNKNLNSITFAGHIPRFQVWDDGSNDPFVNNADDLTIYYYNDFYDDEWNIDRLMNSGLMEKHDFVELTRSDVKGDISGDGTVDESDLQVLLDYFSGKNVDYFDTANADIDGDNAFTRRDVMILNRYLAGWAGYDKYFND